MKRLIILCIAISFAAQMASMASMASGGPRRFVREYCRANAHRILREFIDLLSIPNTASDAENIRRNAAAIMAMMRGRGLEPRLLEAKDPSTPPAIFGELKVPGATRTLVLYSHYDGQPADGSRWASKPWQPVLRSKALESGGQVVAPPSAPGDPLDPEWRLYARSSADDKAGIIVILSALDALAASGEKPTFNIKLFFEGEEEAGSPHLSEIVSLHKELLRSDAWILFDGPVHQSGRKQIVFGVRGITTLDLTVYGANRPLHSGHYGNWAPNPAMALARLLAGLKDDAGRVTVKGFYDDVEPLGEAERRAIAEAPAFDDELRSQLGFARAESGDRGLLEAITLPSLNIDGLGSAEVGAGARNVIPTTASATLDIRVVKGNDHRRQVERLIDHIRRMGFTVTDRDPSPGERSRHALIAKVVARGGGYNAQRTPMDLPISRAVIEAVQSTSNQPVVKLPTLGGSLPLSVLGEALGVPMIIVPVANYDNNQHAENENIRLQNLWEGIEIAAAIMTIRQQ